MFIKSTIFPLSAAVTLTQAMPLLAPRHWYQGGSSQDSGAQNYPQGNQGGSFQGSGTKNYPQWNQGGNSQGSGTQNWNPYRSQGGYDPTRGLPEQWGSGNKCKFGMCPETDTSPPINTNTNTYTTDTSTQPGQDVVQSPTATSFAVTCSGSSGPSCNVFVPVESGFQMYTGSPSASGPWSSLQTPLQFGNGQSPALNTPMAAVNTFDQGGDEIAMFWPQNGALMVMNATSMTSDSFQTYTVASSISTPVHMVATAWRNTGGNPAYSVLFNDDNGVVYQWRRDALGNWNDDGILNGITVNGAFTASVSVNMTTNAHTVDIFTDDGRQIETTSGPTLSGCEVVSQATNTLPGISGGYLPWSDHSEVRLYAIEGGDLTVTMNPPHFGTWSSSPFGGVQPVDPSTVTVATAAAFYTAWGVTHFISVFSLVPNGNQHSIQMISKVPGNPWDSGINLTGPI